MKLCKKISLPAFISQMEQEALCTLVHVKKYLNLGTTLAGLYCHFIPKWVVFGLC